MSVAFDNSAVIGFQITGGSNNFTIGSGANRALAVIAVQDNTLSSPVYTATYNSVPLSVIATDSGTAGVFLGLVNPSSGSNALVVNFTGGGRVDLYILSVSGANQAGGATTFYSYTSNSGTSAAPNVTIPSFVGDMVMAAYLNGVPPNNINFTTPVNGTDIGNNTAVGGGATNATASNWAAGASSVNMSYNMSASTAWACFGVGIKAAGTLLFPPTLGRVGV